MTLVLAESAVVVVLVVVLVYFLLPVAGVLEIR